MKDSTKFEIAELNKLLAKLKTRKHKTLSKGVQRPRRKEIERKASKAVTKARAIKTAEGRRSSKSAKR